MAFAWQYMTDVSNWSDPPAEFALDGSFAAGSSRHDADAGQPPASWLIRDLDPGKSYTIEGGCFSRSRMDALPLAIRRATQRRTKLTQRIELRGENAATYIDDIRAGFEPNLEPGMRKIAENMTRASLESGRSNEPVKDS